MNPSTIGGGDTKLPHSTNNLFTIVQLDDWCELNLRDLPKFQDIGLARKLLRFLKIS